MNSVRKKIESELEFQADLRMQADFPLDTQEMLSRWFDDVFHEDLWFGDDGIKCAFNDQEWDALLEFSNFYERHYGDLPRYHHERVGNYLWESIIAKAKETLRILKRKKQEEL